MPSARVLSTAAADLAEAAAMLAAGAVIAIPTDTVYGLACDAACDEAVMRISRLKGRDVRTPMAVLLADVAMAAPLMSEAPPSLAPLSARWWPGALTLIVPRSAAVTDTVAGLGPGVGLRVPDCPTTVALIRALGRAVAATSANDTGEPPLTDARSIVDHFGDRIDAVIDAGPSPGGVASTVLSLLSVPPTVLRVGGVPRTSLEEVVGPLLP